ncbi:MAG: GHKL domain-containing protein [Hyphomicrobiales bacterium]|nr:GHKL domain-containing protein [Hyphomicrobiales bacterium]
MWRGTVTRGNERPTGDWLGAQGGTRAIFFLLLSIFLVPVFLVPVPSRADDTKRVLILQPVQSDLPVTKIVDTSIRASMQSQMPGRVQIYSEFLDAFRFPELERDETMATFLSEKYAKHRIDLLIATGPQALSFLLRHRASLFPAVPIVFMGIRDDNELLRNLPEGITGLTSDLNPVPTVELALRLQPDARHLVIVTGAGEFDRFWEERAKQTLHHYADRLQVNYLSGLPLAELLRRLGQLPADTIVLYLTVTRDGAGRETTGNIAKELSDAATAPVYSLYDSYLGRGIVGGYMNTFESVGADAGRLAVRILAGERPETMPPHAAGISANYVDERQLQRWGLDESRLPPGTVVRFKELSLWKAYRWQIVLAATLFFAQTILIAALFVQGRRRLRAERAALESEERMNLATTSANLGLWHWDGLRNRLWVSDICRRITGLTADTNLVLEEFLSLIDREDLVTPKEFFDEPATGEKGEKEHQLGAAGDPNRWIRTAGRTKYDASGRPAWITGVVMDITHAKKAERELAHWRQELMHTTRVATLGALSGAVAHELNQPLTAILGNANAAHISLARGNCDMSELGEVISDIETEATRAGEIIRHLRALFVKKDPQYQLVGANQIITDVLKLMHSDLVARKIDVIFRPAPALPVVRGDRIQLQQVFLNLIFNASDAMAHTDPGERSLKIITALNSGTVMVSVSDRGEGVKGDVLERLFQPFFTTKTQGLGLGLSICRSIVESHGGQLQVTGNGESGATFCVTLPVDEAGRNTRHTSHNMHG